RLPPVKPQGAPFLGHSFMPCSALTVTVTPSTALPSWSTTETIAPLLLRPLGSSLLTCSEFQLAWATSLTPALSDASTLLSGSSPTKSMPNPPANAHPDTPSESAAATASLVMFMRVSFYEKMG